MEGLYVAFGVVTGLLFRKLFFLLTQETLLKNHVDWRFTYKTKRRKTHWKCLPERKGRYNANALLFIDDVLGWPLTAPPKNPKKDRKDYR